MYFTAGPNGEADGLFGSLHFVDIRAQPKYIETFAFCHSCEKQGSGSFKRVTGL